MSILTEDAYKFIGTAGDRAARFFGRYWWVCALVVIFLLSYYVRSMNIVPDRLLGFDPIFQYRYTKYIADWGVLPAWDELTYHVGRLIEFTTSPPFMAYLTALVYWILRNLGFTLMTTASYMSAVYGAAIVVPAFLVGQQLSNKWGGLMAATLAGTAPQILVRTFGSSYDTDQLVLFFILLTLYLGIRALRKPTPANFLLAMGGFVAFMLSWANFMYTIFIMAAFAVVYFVLNALTGASAEQTKVPFSERLRGATKELKRHAAVLAALVIGLFLIGRVITIDVMYSISTIGLFAQHAESWIVNISIAELQPFNIFNLQGWTTAMGNFATGQNIVDVLIFLTFIAMIAAAFYFSFKKKDNFCLAFLLTLLVIGIYTTSSGIRFTEFTSTFFITLVAIGFGYFVEWSNKDRFIKSFAIGLCMVLALVAFGIGAQLGQQVGPDINANWDSAWAWLKQNTPENAIVGTWWDPGHMIAGLAERRNYADGAHCYGQCLWNINDRITDLGKIMATSDENQSLALIRKYQGTSPKAYWIASDDLIGKFQWLQYFGTGCDARAEARCPLYAMVGLQSYLQASDGNIIGRNYGNVVVLGTTIPVPLITQGSNAAVFNEAIIYDSEGKATTLQFSKFNMTALTEQLKPLTKQLNVRLLNQTAPYTVWIQRDWQYIVVIPPNLRQSVFTKMFFLEGEGLEHFKQVFANEQVKIYEVV